MNILLLGSGGREHAFAVSLSKGKTCTKLYTAPGNPGTAFCGENVALNTSDFESVAQFCFEKNIAMLVVGPEEPLVHGIRDFLEKDKRTQNLVIIGPGAAGARLEGSKDFSKAFMERHKIPTAKYRSFQPEQYPEAVDFLNRLSAPYVIKASGLAAGKGVLIVTDKEAAQQEVELMFKGKFGEAGKTVVIEEFLEGIECSVFVLTDGENYIELPEAKDYKRIGEGDTGLNTGGMGAVSPVPFYDDALRQKVKQRIIEPTIRGLKTESIPYRGFIFFGLMIVKGEPFVIEYNCRMGDPETEVVLPRIKSDLAELLYTTGSANLNQKILDTDPRTALTVIAVSGGYPETYKKGFSISGIEQNGKCNIFQAGTSYLNGQILTSGGRVIACTALADSIEVARELSYSCLANISYEGMYFRKDIGLDLIKLK